MNKKYSLGNHGNSYELIDAYLGYIPRGYKSWFDWQFPGEVGIQTPALVTLEKDENIVSLKVVKFIIKDAFHSEVYHEERFDNWNSFAICHHLGDEKNQFIIPCH